MGPGENVLTRALKHFEDSGLDEETTSIQFSVKDAKRILKELEIARGYRDV